MNFFNLSHLIREFLSIYCENLHSLPHIGAEGQVQYITCTDGDCSVMEIICGAAEQ